MLNWESELANKLSQNIINKTFDEKQIISGEHLFYLEFSKKLLETVITLNSNPKVLQELSLRKRKDRDVKDTDIIYITKILGSDDLQNLFKESGFTQE